MLYTVVCCGGQLYYSILRRVRSWHAKVRWTRLESQILRLPGASLGILASAFRIRFWNLGLILGFPIWQVKIRPRDLHGHERGIQLQDYQ